jgi:hypothetical protein
MAQREQGERTAVSLMERAVEELCSPGAVERFKEVHLDRTARIVRSVVPQLVRWEAREDDPHDLGLIPPPGSVLLVWARRGDKVLRQLDAAYCNRDIDELRRAYDALVADHRARPVLSLDEAARELRSTPVYCDVRYAGRTLASNLWPPKSGCGSMLLPYSGGDLRSEDFQVVQYVRADAEALAVDVILVASAPHLTEIERRALEAVSADMTELHVGSFGLVAATPATLVVIAVFVAINTIVTTCCDPLRDRMAEISLPPETLIELGSVASVAQLVAMRAEVIQSFAT